MKTIITFMLIGWTTASWDSGLLSHYGSIVPNITNTDSINHIDIPNTLLTGLPINLYDFLNLMSVDIRHSPILYCVIFYNWKRRCIVFTTDRNDCGIWKRNYINYVIGVLEIMQLFSFFHIYWSLLIVMFTASAVCQNITDKMYTHLA